MRQKWVNIDLLVEVEHVACAFLIGNFNVAQVVLELYIHHFLCDDTSKLICVDIDLNLIFFISPRELRNFLRWHGGLLRSSSLFLHLTFCLRICTNKDGVTTVDFSISLEVLSAISVKVFIGMGIIILDKEYKR